MSIILVMKTTVSISKQTRHKLADIGNKDSTFDDIIQKLIQTWEINNG